MSTLPEHADAGPKVLTPPGGHPSPISVRAKVLAVLVCAVMVCTFVYYVWEFREEMKRSVPRSRLATVQISGRWVECDAPFKDDELEWTCLGVIVEEDSSSLVIMANQDCLRLGALRWADELGVEVKAYELKCALMESKEFQRVTQFADCDGTWLDIVLLRVERGEARRGVNFDVAPICNRDSVRIGTEVVAIGAPNGSLPTETIGSVKSIAPPHVQGGEHAMIETNVMLTPHNSGGPLFGVIWGRRQLIGVNACVGSGAVGPKPAHFADEYTLKKDDWRWFNADPAGAASALKEIYRKSASPAR
jgi:hypothetical protein